jgi:hypothetical protein
MSARLDRAPRRCDLLAPACRVLFAPVGVANSDTHTKVRDPSLPRTFARVPDDEVRAALLGRGAFALAITNPLFVDVDGGGYTAPFAP